MNYYSTEELRSMEYRLFLSTCYWQRVQKAVFERDSHKCIWCECPNGLEAHHVDYSHRGDELNHLEDVVTLCSYCHSVVHKKPIRHPKGTGLRMLSESMPETFNRLLLESSINSEEES